jgi:squalene/oxidosqualene cyclase-like protein
MPSAITTPPNPEPARTAPPKRDVPESSGPQPAESSTTDDRRSRAQRAYAQAVEHLEQRQQPNGAWAGEVVWNPMLVCQYVIVCHILGHPIADDRRARVRLSLERQVNADGGWGMHPDSDTYLFHTVLGYVALRLLGYDKSDPLTARALQWIRDQGNVYTIPTWGRIWLAMLGLYPWSGVQPILPELWLLPDASPMHPRRLYCHMRLIYLGLSYVYGARFVAPMDRTVSAIRRELYPEGYDERRFARHRDQIAATDLFEAPQPALRAAFAVLRGLEKLCPRALRRKALSRAMSHILFEFRSTNYVCLSPVNGFLFCLALFISDPRHPEIAKALRGMEYWVWEDEIDGLRFAGARSDIWDTSFILSALCEGPRSARSDEMVRKACRWLPTAQILEEIVGGAAHYRSPAYGGWGFANEHHPWPVSDCTAEALEALMRADATGLCDEAGGLQLGRKLAALEFILARQNDDGGFGSYEARRGSMLLRNYNPAEIYGNCMLEYSYTECSGSCVRALAYAVRALGDEIPTPLRTRVRTAIEAGNEFLLTQQRDGGGWLGFWGVNITYGTFFAVSGLHSGGLSSSMPPIRRACRWLVEAQRPDGGWGESYRGILEERDAQLPPDAPSLAVQTAWAVLTLLEAAPHERDAIDRGIDYLISLQRDDGAWPRELATGVFFNTAVLDYVLYRQAFPTWALARYLSTAPDS